LIWLGLVILAAFGGLAIYASLPRRPAGVDNHNTPDARRAFGPMARIGFSTLPVIAAVILYSAIGMPQIPSRPYSERAGERNLAAAAAAANDVTDPDFQTDQQIRRLLSQIVLSLEANPRNLQGWVVLARGSLRLGDIERAVAAFARAYALSGHNPLLAIEYADTRITAQQGQIDKVSRDLILHALGQMPNHQLSRYYYGMMLKQQDKYQQALNVFTDLYRDIPKDDPLSGATEAEIQLLNAEIADATQAEPN
jgi:cytochrome c-type biogenesis protein CcmH|tara:strand:+ start:18333 stop:19091 length:759 start_codon:yes stop_codon:yes gene_type:complete